MPIIIPYLVLVISVYLIIGPILDKPTIEYLYATFFILGGMVFYVPFVHYKLRIPFMGESPTITAKLLRFYNVFSFCRWCDSVFADDSGGGANVDNVGVNQKLN